MSIYAIGDVQGCYKELMELLALIDFDLGKDQLWFTGDLINRGPQSLEVLRFVKNLGDNAITVLGNHDIHYLAVASGAVSITKQDTFQDVIQATDAKNLFDWLRYRPMIHYDKIKNFLLVHAGIPPVWDITTALHCAHEVEEVLRGQNYLEHFIKMYENFSGSWQNTGMNPQERFNLIINYCTRMRFVDSEGNLELQYKDKENPDEQPANYFPWFKMPSLLAPEINVIFGHWAALGGKTDIPHRFAIDTGCCWGDALTALRLEDLHYFSVKCHYPGVKHD